MIGSAMLFVLGRKGRKLREDNDTKQEQDENAPPNKSTLPCHYVTYHTPIAPVMSPCEAP